MLRKTFFWLHLVAGLIAGLVVAVMSFTGAALAFEKDLIGWAEHDLRHVIPPKDVASRLSLSELLQRLREIHPDVRPIALTLTNDQTAAVSVTLGRDTLSYIDPYDGTIRKPTTTRMRDLMNLMERWHRFLGFANESSRPIGKALTGACNLAFLVLAVSGLYLWWPRRWSWRGFKALAVFNLRLTSKARDFNWHNSIGFWTAPTLIILTLTAIPMSYRWGNNLVYRLTGTELPAQTAGPNSNNPNIAGPMPEPVAKPLAYDALLAAVQNQIPNWSEITFRFGNPREQHPNSSASNGRPGSPQPISIVVRTANAWPLFSTTTLSLDPFTGSVLKNEAFADQNAGRRLRSWTRFLHTGEALGWPGQLLAALASLGALFLVWTGLALTFRRFFPRKQNP